VTNFCAAAPRGRQAVSVPERLVSGHVFRRIELEAQLARFSPEDEGRGEGARATIFQ